MDKRILVLTGAGISADSRIPTFRGKDGYYRKRDPRKLATARAFRRNPKKVWRWYCERRKLVRGARPNAAHRALALLARRFPNLLLVTQNVDDLHERAGVDPRQIVHIHGDLFRNVCTACGRASLSRGCAKIPPLCPFCGAENSVRPGVVWFDEDLDAREERRIRRFLRQGRCDLVLVVGTMASFPYIRRWARQASGAAPGGRRKRKRGLLIEVNPESTRLTRSADLVVRRRAAAALPQLVAEILSGRELAAGEPGGGRRLSREKTKAAPAGGRKR